MKPGRLLLVTQLFPPALSSPSIVVGKAAKYLLREGWQITVLTGRKPGFEDPALLRDVGKLEDIYEFRLLGYSDFPSLLRPWVKNFSGLSPYRGSGLWYPSAKRALQKILAENSYDVILTVHSPAPALIRLVAEIPAPHSLKAVWYLDPWNISSLASFRDAVKGFFWRPLEKSLLRSFHLILLSSEFLLQEYQRAIPEKAMDCFFYPQGFDPEDFVPFAGQEATPSTVFRIGYFGTLRPSEFRALQVLMESLSYLPPQVRSSIELYIRAWVTPRRRTLLLTHYARLHRRFTNGPSFFTFRLLTEPLPYHQTLAEMAKMSAFLTSRDLPQLSVYSGKIFQYLAFRKPILFIGPGGCPEGMLVERAGCGRAFPIEKHPVRALTDYVATLYSQSIRGTSLRNIQEAVLETMNLRTQASLLSQQLRSMLAQK